MNKFHLNIPHADESKLTGTEKLSLLLSDNEKRSLWRKIILLNALVIVCILAIFYFYLSPLPPFF